MPELNVTSQTTLQQLKQFSDGVSEGHEIRGKQNKDGSITLYSKDPKSFSLGMKKGARDDKITAAKTAINNILDRATGGRTTGLNHDVTRLFIDHMPSTSKTQVSKEHLSGLLTSVDRKIQDVEQKFATTVDKATLTRSMQARLSVLMGTKATPQAGTLASENAQADPLRSGSLSESSKLAIKNGDINQLDVGELAHGTKWMLKELGPSIPRAGLQTLLRSTDTLQQAVGTLTYQNSYGKTVIGPEHELAQPASIQEGGEALRDLVDETFTSEQKTALKERAKFLKDLAGLMDEKVGLCARGLDSTENTNAWAKSLTVAGGIEFLGFEPMVDCRALAEDGTGIKDAIGAGRNLMTAMVMHYDTIFGE